MKATLDFNCDLGEGCGDDAAIMSKCTVIADVGEHTMVGANCLRAVTTSHTEWPHRPLS